MIRADSVRVFFFCLVIIKTAPICGAKGKAERGERVGTVIPYGYKRDPEIKGHLLINPETAPVVKMIFSLCAEGKGPRVIANALREKKIPKPTMY